MDSPINVAHRHQRKAESLVEAGKYAEAIEHHKAAERVLGKVVVNSNNESIQQSIKLQREYHVRQQAVIRYKERRAKALKIQLEALKKKQCAELSTILTSENENNDCSLVVRQSVQAMYEHDSLISCLEYAIKRDASSTAHLSQSVDSSTAMMKTPKDNRVKIEELRSSSESLKQTLYLLISELEKIRSENKMLRTSLADLLQSQKEIILDNPADVPISPQIEQTAPKIIENSNKTELPALAPLKVPNIDFPEK